MSSPTRVGAIVTQNSSLRQLVRQSLARGDTDRRVKSLLDADMREHVVGTVIRDENMTLLADSPAWAAKLRYSIATIRQRMAADESLPSVRTIRIKVAPRGVARAPQVRRQAPLGEKTAAVMREQASAIADPALREAVLRLTGRTKRG